MKQLVTTAIILTRMDYGEADRILTLLTPDFGKRSMLAKGVRRVKSKLAGGIELFSVSQITFIKGRGSLDSLVSTRLIRHYEVIIKHLDRTMLGYELIKQLNRITEDEPEPEYFELGEQLFEALNDPEISLDLVRVWFAARLLRLGGHEPNLKTDTTGAKLLADQQYLFSYDDMAFAVKAGGQFTADHIKYLRLLFNGNTPRVLRHIHGADELIYALKPLVQTMAQTHLHISVSTTR